MKAALLIAAAGALLTAPLVAAPANAAPPGEESVHVVKAGETLNGIANRAGVSPGAIARANKLKEPWSLRAGQKLAIPREAKAPVKVAAAKPVTKPVARPSEPAASKAGRTAARVIAARGPTGNPETENEHTVLTGETLGGIAARAKVPRVLIAEANGLQPPYDVRVGQTLRIPRTRHHTVKSGDTGFSIAMDYGVAWDQIALANSLDPAAPVKPGQNLLIPTLLDPPPSGGSKADPAPQVAAVPAARKPARFAWPLAGPTRRGYATGSDYHDGLDITAPKGAMVRAAAAGTVLFAGNEKEQFGNLVVVDHGDGWHTAYAFLSRVTVKEGAKVAAGERVGLVGDTGRAKGNELHFEVRRDGKPVDPLDELPKAP